MSDFEGWYKEFQTHRQFPMSIEANNLYVARMAYEAARLAGLEEAVRTIELEKEKIIHSPMFIGLGDYRREDQCDVIAAAIRERIK